MAESFADGLGGGKHGADHPLDMTVDSINFRRA